MTSQNAHSSWPAAPAATSSRAGRGRGAARARLARPLAGRAGQHGKPAGAAARFCVRDHRLLGRARQGRQDPGRCCRCACSRPSGRASRVVRRVKPDVVIGLGGYITFPGRHDERAAGQAAGAARAELGGRHGQPDPGGRGRPGLHGLPQRAGQGAPGSATRCARRSCSSRGRPSAWPRARGRCACWWWAAAWAPGRSTRSCRRRWR